MSVPTSRRAVYLSAAILLSTILSQPLLSAPPQPQPDDTPAPEYTPPSTDPQAIKLGKDLFLHRWTPNDPLAKADGLGPLFNGASCVECHNQGGAGGGSDNSHNISNFEALPTRFNREFTTGNFHRKALTKESADTAENLRKAFPVIQRGAIVNTGGKSEFRTVDPVSIVNVNSTALFGDGLIEAIPDKVLLTHKFPASSRVGSQDVAIYSTHIRPGRARILPDGRVGKFGWKAQIATLNEFVAAAAANEVGLGTPISVQATPIGTKAGEVEPDLDARQLEGLTAYVAALSPPRMIIPAKPNEREFVLKGQALFNTIGCAACHCPDLGEVKGIYSDLLLHDLSDQTAVPFAALTMKDKNSNPLPIVNVPQPYYGENANAAAPVPLLTSTVRSAVNDEHPRPDEWRTPPLWGCADSAPFVHDGSAPTLRDAVNKHLGDARIVKERFDKLGNDQQYVFAFLLMLRAPADADRVPPPPKAPTPQRIEKKITAR